jgi:hypothetical protein
LDIRGDGRSEFALLRNPTRILQDSHAIPAASWHTSAFNGRSIPADWSV